MKIVFNCIEFRSMVAQASLSLHRKSWNRFDYRLQWFHTGWRTRPSQRSWDDG